MSARNPATLVLEDGFALRGWSCGALGEATGEVCFNTSMTGYQEILTDPSYAGQIVTLTVAHVGVYGVNGADMESRGCFARGLVVRSLADEPSSWRSEEPLTGFLARHGVVAIEGVDTRALVRHLRERGAMRGVISTERHDVDELVAVAQADPGLVGRDLVREVAIGAPYEWGEAPPGAERPADVGPLPASPRFHVVAIDSGIKYGILRCLAEAGCSVSVVPPTTDADAILAREPDGVFLANGPGDPAPLDYLFSTVRGLIGRIPVFGICLGHQMLGLAVGAGTYKLKYGHRGGNHPVMDLETGRVEITSHNHGFCVDFASIGPLDPAESGGLELDPADLGAWVRARRAPVVVSERFGRVMLTHVDLNDMTCEGIRLLDAPAFSVQYHPEAQPGPRDAHYLFDRFVQLMERGATTSPDTRATGGLP